MTMTGMGQRHQLSVGALLGGIPCVAPLVMVMLVLGAGCYNPKVTPGGLRCATTGDKLCPDGFVCVAGTCNEPGSSGGGGRGGAAGMGGPGGTGGVGSGGAGGTCANAIAPLCTPPAGGAGGCDPVCRTGCPCGQRCGVSTGGTACSAVVGAKAVGEICTLGLDDCGPGLVCLTEPCGTNLGRCYRYCRDNTLCGPGGVCGTPVNLPDGNPSGQKVCNVGDQLPACNVYGRTGCPDPALVCYISNAGTTCDCPSAVNAMEGQACSFYNDCAPGLTCLTIRGETQCHRVCRTSADCAGGGACTLTGAFGYCP